MTCVGCGGGIAPALARLGSTRCHDCRDGNDARPRVNVPGVVFSGALELLATVEQYAHEDFLPAAVLKEAARFRATVEEHVEVVP